MQEFDAARRLPLLCSESDRVKEIAGLILLQRIDTPTHGSVVVKHAVKHAVVLVGARHAVVLEGASLGQHALVGACHAVVL